MVVCKFFLSGQCKFGDRCRYEHPRGGPSNSGVNYNQGGQSGYNQARGSLGSQGTYNSQIQSNPYVYINKNVGSYSVSDGREHFSDGRGGGGGGGQKAVMFRDSFDTGQNRFTALGDSVDQDGRSDDLRPQDIIEGVRHDMEEWEANKMWPFSSYKPMKFRQCLPGLDDILPDEVRFVAYTAMAENKFDQHKQCMDSLRELYKSHKAALRAPSQDMASKLIHIYKEREPMLATLFKNSKPIIKLLYSLSGLTSGTDFGGASTAFGGSSMVSGVTGFSFDGGFGSPVPSGKDQPAGAGLFGKPVTPGATGGAGLFGKPAVAVAPEMGLFGKLADSGLAAGLFGKAMDGSTVGGSGGLFGKTATQSDLFGKKQDDQRSLTGVGTGSHVSRHYTALDELTPEEKEAFMADTFTLGKVPTRPPPLELCR